MSEQSNSVDNRAVISRWLGRQQEQQVLYGQVQRINEEFAHYRAQVLAGVCPEIRIFNNDVWEVVWDGNEDVAKALALIEQHRQLAIEALQARAR